MTTPRPKFYVTTPIYYVNDAPHIGHCYTTLLADALARHHRLAGRDTFFLTGTDEHAEKVVSAAAERGISPIEWADKNAAAFRAAFDEMEISCDDFIRTTEHRHTDKVREYIQRLVDQGDIALGDYEGWWDPSQEEYITETAARENDFKSPVTGKELVKRTEQNYFFDLTKYESRLLEHIENNPGFIKPDARRNEVLGRIRQGLQRVPVSRAIDDADAATSGASACQATTPTASTSGSTPSSTTSQPSTPTNEPSTSPPTSTSSPRTSSGSTPSSGPASSWPSASPSPPASTPTPTGSERDAK